MNLIEQQRLLAELYTNSGIREKYFSNAPSMSLKENEVSIFAKGLLLKRLNAVKSMLSLSFSYDESLLSSYFMEYASVNTMQGLHLKHYKDTLSFCKFMNGKKQFQMNNYLFEIVRYERFLLESAFGKKRIMFFFFRYRFYKATIQNIQNTRLSHGNNVYILFRLHTGLSWIRIFKEF